MTIEKQSTPPSPRPGMIRKRTSIEDFECPICGQVFCAPVTTPCNHTFCKPCLSYWIFDMESSTCPSCRGALDAEVVSKIDLAADAAVRAAFPDEWKVRMHVAMEESNKVWREQLPFLFCQDNECSRMVRNLQSINSHNQTLAQACPRVIRSMLSIPKRWFLPPSLRPRAYDSAPVRLETLQFNVSAPEVYGYALELLDLRPGLSVLDVGSGCGLFTCLAGALVSPGGRALGVDIRETAVSFARRNLERARSLVAADASATLGAAEFEGTVQSRNNEDAAADAASAGGGDGGIESGADSASGADPRRMLLRVTRELGPGRFEAKLALAPEKVGSRGVEWVPFAGECAGTSVRLTAWDRGAVVELSLAPNGELRGACPESIFAAAGGGEVLLRPVDAGKGLAEAEDGARAALSAWRAAIRTALAISTISALGSNRPLSMRATSRMTFISDRSCLPATLICTL